jgi:hypothetical protein
MALYELVQSIEMVPGGVGFWSYGRVIYVNVNDFGIDHLLEICERACES